MDYFAEGSPETIIDSGRASELVDGMLQQMGKLDRVLLLPPDITRFYSGAGELTCMLYEKLRSNSHVEILPAIGTHSPMTGEEMDRIVDHCVGVAATW